jgi:parvulin-like peptidyl-prolyl isomerase
MACKLNQFIRVFTFIAAIGFCLPLCLFSPTAHSADGDDLSSDELLMEDLQEQSREKREKRKARRREAYEQNPDVEDHLREMEAASDEKRYERQNERDQRTKKEPPAEGIKALEEQSKATRRSANALGTKRFSRIDLTLDLPPDTVLATLNADPLLYVDEFNQRIRPSSKGNDLYEVRYKELVRIIDTKLVAALAKKKGFENDPLVRTAKNFAQKKAQTGRNADELAGEVSDEQARRYYSAHIDQFKRPDSGTRVRFVVVADMEEARSIQKRINNGEPFSKFCFLPDPIPGTWLPSGVQEAVFALEPGQITDVIKTPVGIFIGQLVARNHFDNFKVSVVIKSSLAECRQVIQQIESGREFESLVAEKGHLAVDSSDLPKAVQPAIPEMDLNQISQPIATPLGYFLVKLQDRWSEAEIISAKLIQLKSEAEGLNLLARMENGSGLGQIKERQIAGADLPVELMAAAKRLNENEYSAPVKTALGYYLVKVEKRRREKYLPFQNVADEIKMRIKAKTIEAAAAYRYYQSNLSDYRKPGPEYILDIILSNNADQAEAIIAGLKRIKEETEKRAAFKKYQKDLDQKVTADLLPAACRKIAAGLQPGQISPSIATPIGYYILRLDQIVNPAFVKFENVREDIRLLLVQRTSTKDAQTDEHRAQIALISAEEKALERVYRRHYMKNIDSVTAEEAEMWWQANKSDFFAAFGSDEKQFESANKDPEKVLRFKKKNLLLQRYLALKKDLHAENDVVIFDHLLMN